MTAILHVTDSYDGGVFDSINKVAELCPQYDHTLLFAGNSFPPKALFKNTMSLNSLSWQTRWQRLNFLFNSEDFDIIHIHSSRMGFLGRLVRTKRPIIYQPHGISYEQNFPNILKRFFLMVEWILGKKTTKFLAVSQNEKDQISRIVSSEKISIVPNSSKMSPSTNPEKKKYIVTIGRVIDLKDPMLFAEIASLASGLNLTLSFVWIGSGDADLEQKLAQEGVTVTGWLDKEEMARYLSSSALYIHTSSFEAFPISIIDAAVYDIPILVRDIPAFSTSKLTKFTNAEDALERIRVLFSNVESHAQLVEISKQIYLENNPAAQKENYENVIGSLVNNG
jgi:glycosyltransferase involved in cell wall biosynthesis